MVFRFSEAAAAAMAASLALRFPPPMLMWMCTGISRLSASAQNTSSASPSVGLPLGQCVRMTPR